MLNTKNLHNPAAAQWLLRAGLAFVFAYAGFESLRQPLTWVGYLPHFLAVSEHAVVLLKLIAVYELGLAAWLLVGRYVRLAAALAALTIGGIVLANPAAFIITFRDVGLLLMALALLFGVSDS